MLQITQSNGAKEETKELEPTICENVMLHQAYHQYFILGLSM